MNKRDKGTGTDSQKEQALSAIASSVPPNKSSEPRDDKAPTVDDATTLEQLYWSSAPDAMKARLAREQLIKDLVASTNAPLITAPAPGIVPLGGGRKLQRK